MFFCKQKTAYELRISDWSSDVCSSDLYRKLAASAAPETPSGVAAKVVSIADFRAKFARRSDAVVDTEPSADLGFGGGAAGIDTTNIALQIGRASCRERVCQYV